MLSILTFGAEPNILTDQKLAIEAADEEARQTNQSLFFPGGIYWVSSLVFKTNSNWIGEGRNLTTIKQLPDQNQIAVLYGGTITEPILGATIRDMTINGNWKQMVSSPDSYVPYIYENNEIIFNNTGTGLFYFGARPILENLFITNCADFGLQTGFILNNYGGADAFGMEGYLNNIKIDHVGKHGWYNFGPNDTVSNAISIIDAGQQIDNTYSGLYCGAFSQSMQEYTVQNYYNNEPVKSAASGRFSNLHVWSRDQVYFQKPKKYIKYCVNVNIGTNCDFVSGCHFEGAKTANVRLATPNCVFDSSTKYYAVANNGINILIEDIVTHSIIHGIINSPYSGISTGIKINSCYFYANKIDLIMNSQNPKIEFNNCIDKYNEYNIIPKETDSIEHKFDMQRINILGLCDNTPGVYECVFANSFYPKVPIVNFSVFGDNKDKIQNITIYSLNSFSVIFRNYNSESVTIDMIASI